MTSTIIDFTLTESEIADFENMIYGDLLEDEKFNEMPGDEESKVEEKASSKKIDEESPSPNNVSHFYRNSLAYNEYINILSKVPQNNNLFVFLTINYIDEIFDNLYIRPNNDPKYSILRMSLSVVPAIIDAENKLRLSKNYEQRIYRLDNQNVRICPNEFFRKKLKTSLVAYMNDKMNHEILPRDKLIHNGNVELSVRMQSIDELINTVINDLCALNVNTIHCRINGKFFKYFLYAINRVCDQRQIPRFKFYRVRNFYSQEMPISSICANQLDHCSRTCEVCFVSDLQNKQFDKSVYIQM